MARIVVRGVVLTALLSVCLAPPARAQGSLDAISGVVMDQSGGALPGVTVTLSSPGVIGGNQTTVSDGQGAYRFERLVAGRYTVKAELQGFQTVLQEGLVVNADRTSRADLKLGVGDLAETITVSGEAPVLDTRSALQQTPLTREVLDTVPTLYDTWSIVRLAPTIAVAKYDVGGRSMFGQSNVSSHGSNEREYFVDGMDLNQYGGTFYIDSFAFEEVNIQTANLPAERSTSGVVWNFVTKTGSNAFHGAASFLGMTHAMEFDNISPDLRTQLLAAVPDYALAANPNPRLGESIEHMFDTSATWSGPIVRNRLWYSAAVKLGEVYTRRVGSYNEDGTQLLSDNQLRQTTAKISFAATPQHNLHYVHSWVHKGRYTVAGGPTVTEFFSKDAAIYNPARHWLHIADGRVCCRRRPCWMSPAAWRTATTTWSRSRGLRMARLRDSTWRRASTRSPIADTSFNSATGRAFTTAWPTRQEPMTSRRATRSSTAQWRRGSITRRTPRVGCSRSIAMVCQSQCGRTIRRRLPRRRFAPTASTSRTGGGLPPS